jgi:hypothetical protein
LNFLSVIRRKYRNPQLQNWRAKKTRLGMPGGPEEDDSRVVSRDQVTRLEGELARLAQSKAMPKQEPKPRQRPAPKKST